MLCGFIDFIGCDPSHAFMTVGTQGELTRSADEGPSYHDGARVARPVLLLIRGPKDRDCRSPHGVGCVKAGAVVGHNEGCLRKKSGKLLYCRAAGEISDGMPHGSGHFLRDRPLGRLANEEDLSPFLLDQPVGNLGKSRRRPSLQVAARAGCHDNEGTALLDETVRLPPLFFAYPKRSEPIRCRNTQILHKAEMLLGSMKAW